MEASGAEKYGLAEMVRLIFKLLMDKVHKEGHAAQGMPDILNFQSLIQFFLQLFLCEVVRSPLGLQEYPQILQFGSPYLPDEGRDVSLSIVEDADGVPVGFWSSPGGQPSRIVTPEISHEDITSMRTRARFVDLIGDAISWTMNDPGN